MAVSETHAPFTEPYAKAGNPSGFRSKGNTALAVKRALAHLGFLDWEPDKWDIHWNAKTSDAAAAWKRKRGLIPESSQDGSWGEKAHSTMRGTWFEKNGQRLDAFDGESQRLLREEKAEQPPPPSRIAQVQQRLTEFAELGLDNGWKWTYAQDRAVDAAVDPAGYVTSDCSGSVIQAFNYSQRKTGWPVPDPSKYSYAGWGNTWDDEDGHPKVTNGQYQVGDLAHYDGHVCMCITAGNADTADWWSFGSEPPSRRKLYYRTDFKFVVRPPLT